MQSHLSSVSIERITPQNEKVELEHRIVVARPKRVRVSSGISNSGLITTVGLRTSMTSFEPSISSVTSTIGKLESIFL